jgi:peroxiredoxin
MTIKVGDRIPECTLKVMGEKGPQNVTTADLFSGKKVVMFTVPGAFTPGCTITHLPGFVLLADQIKAKGVDSIICMSVVDAFVMDAWGKSQNAENLIMLADGNGEMTSALGIEMDIRNFGMGIRCQRSAMIVEDGVVTFFAMEKNPSGIVETSAEAILQML